MFEFYEPEKRIPNVQYLFSKELNMDWYDYRNTIDNDKIKITIDGDNVVRQCASNVFSLFPAMCRVIVLDDDVIIPDNINEGGDYLFVDNKFVPFVSEVMEQKNMDLIFKKAFYYSVKSTLSTEEKDVYEELKATIIKYGDENF